MLNADEKLMQTQFNKEEREEVFHPFFNLSSIYKQRHFLQSHTKRQQNKEKTINNLIVEEIILLSGYAKARWN